MTSYYVYFIKSDKHTKVGVTRNVRRRMSILQTGNQFILKLDASIQMRSKKEAFELELFLHKYYSACRASGEWFLLKDKKVKEALTKYHEDGGSLPESVSHKQEFNRSSLKKKTHDSITEIKTLKMQRARLVKILNVNNIAFSKVLYSDECNASQVKKG